jgi:excinuclease ABC subunit C
VNQFDPARLALYPDQPGVYLMKDERGVVLYVGKAKRLKTRLRQYFSPSSSDERIQIPYLLPKVADIETIVTSSEKEALLLEATLIKRFLPRYNILLKDDRSRLLLRIGCEHPWPRIELVRARDATALPPKIFGPYAGFHAAQGLLDLVVRLFFLRQCTNDEFRRRVSPCLLYQMRRCTAPCVGRVTKEEYAQQVAAAMDFLSGKTKEVAASLRQQIEEASTALEFEKAARLHRSLQQLSTVSTTRHAVAGATDTDVIGVAQEDSRLALAILHYRGSTLVYGESWVFDLLQAGTPTTEVLQQLVVQYYLHRVALDGVPKEILFPQGDWSLEPLEEVVHEHFGTKVVCRRPAIGSKGALVALACDNALARLTQRPESRGYGLHSLESLQHSLFLRRFPRIIDCFDASHFGGTGLVAASVGFVDGKKETSRYRKFHIRGVTVGDDCAILREAIARRYAHADGGEELPDLIIIDGGREQLRAALLALQELSFLDVDVVGIAKEHGRHDKGMTAEILFVLGQEPIRLPPTSQELLFLQSVRDEAHRFVITFQRRYRSAVTFKSQLDTIPGVGPKRRQALLRAFHSVEALRKASAQELHERAGLGLKQAQRVLDALKYTDVSPPNIQ